MRIKRKLKSIIIVFYVMIVVMWFAWVIWAVIISDFVPWTRRGFPSHQSYIELLNEQHCFGGSFFVQDVPASFGEAEYYWHRDFVDRYAVYSIILTKEDYETIAESRLSDYNKKAIDKEKTIVYVMPEDEKDYIDDSEGYKEELNFIDEVIQNPEEKHQYYYLIIARYYTTNGTSYNGVILNDTTRELVEFSVEIGDEEKYL